MGLTGKYLQETTVEFSGYSYTSWLVEDHRHNMAVSSEVKGSDDGALYYS